MSTDTKAPDFAGIAKRIAEAEYPAPPYEPMPEGLDEVFAPDVRYTKQHAYASCMEARLRSDWETIRLLRKCGHTYDCAIHNVDRECQSCGARLVYKNGYTHAGMMFQRHGAHPGDPWEGAKHPDCTCGLRAHLSTLQAQFQLP